MIHAVDAVSVDRFVKKDRFEMIYNLLSLENNERVFIKIRLDSKKPEMESLIPCRNLQTGMKEKRMI
ncbi:MAG: NADH-quinone oxidoreductase subunit C [Ignavibacteria bacterium]